MNRVSAAYATAFALLASSAAIADDQKKTPPEVTALALTGYKIDVDGPRELSGVAARPDRLGHYAVVGDTYEDEEDWHKVWLWPKTDGHPWDADKDDARPHKDRESIDIAIDNQGNQLRMVLGEGKGSTPATLSYRWKVAGQPTVHKTVNLTWDAYKSVAEDDCGRGLEGMSLRWNDDKGLWQLALLWEGGFKQDDGETCGYDKPLLGVLEWAAGPEPDWSKVVFTDLKVPERPSDGQSFRAPDLAWHPRAERLIVLISSSGKDSEGKTAFCHTWLQEYDADGIATSVPHKIRDWRGKDCRKRNKKHRLNWEALDISADGCFVMGYDNGDGAKESHLVVFRSPLVPAVPHKNCNP